MKTGWIKEEGSLVMAEWLNFIVIFDQDEYKGNETYPQFVQRVLYWKHTKGNLPYETNDHLPLGGEGAEFVANNDREAAESYWEFLTAGVPA